MINAIIIRRLIQVSNAHADPFCGYEYMKFGFRSLFMVCTIFTRPGLSKSQVLKALLNRQQGRRPLFRGSLMARTAVGCHKGDF